MEIESFDPKSVDGPTIIAMKGLPCTGKTRVAKQIGRWAKCPVLSIDDFIRDDDHIEGSWEEAERLQARVLQQAFVSLCKVALSQLRNEFSVVVIKSRLLSTFEVEQVLQMVQSLHGSLLIVDCEMRNKYRWQRRFNTQYSKKWYRPRSWNDVEKARDDHYDTGRANWDLQLLHLIHRYGNYRWPIPALVKRLVVDPYSDLDFPMFYDLSEGPNPIFAHALNYLLTNNAKLESPYVVEFDEFRRSRADQFLNALIPSTRGKYYCQGGGCLFKYLEEVRGDDNVEGSRCGLCEEKVGLGQPAYACHFCILTLHESCVEMIDIDSYLYESLEYQNYYQYLEEPPGEKYACKACTDKGLAFDECCNSCHFQMFLKRRLVPPVVNHDHHPHSLSLRMWKEFVCEACGLRGYFYSYVCKICEWYYHIQCVFMPGELEHGHGGHEHVLKLKYSQDNMEEEDYWCDVCYEDLDPYLWFYSCQSCPDYPAHVYCAGVYPRRLWDREW